MSSGKVLKRLSATLSHIRKPKSIQHLRSTATMATATVVSLTPDTAGVLHVPRAQISPDASARASELLQKNHDDFHMYCKLTRLDRDKISLLSRTSQHLRVTSFDRVLTCNRTLTESAFTTI